MAAQPRILVLIDNELRSAPRAQTMVRAAKDLFDVTVAALAKDQEPGYKFINLDPGRDQRENFHFGYPWLIRKTVSAGLKIRKQLRKFAPGLHYERIIWNHTARTRLAQLETLYFDAIIVHHIHNLPLAAKLARRMNAKLFMNAHEYYPLEFDNDPAWMAQEQPRIQYICEKYIKYVTTVFAASPGYARAWSENHGVNSIMIPCVKPLSDLKPQLTGEEIKLVHQGYANPDRKIETMIEMMDHVDSRFRLYLHLMPTDRAYYEKLRQMCQRYRNIYFRDPFKPEELVSEINKYDIGLYILEPTNFNTTWMLPNKIFEFIQARLVTAISPAKGMVPYIDEHGIGLVSDDHSPLSMARALSALDNEKIMHYKLKADVAARATSAETYYPLIREELSKHLLHVRH